MATPAGKGSFSRTSIASRKLAATKTPRMLTRNTHSISQGQGSVCPVSMVSAGIGATSPPETMEAEAEAAVWLMLFSRNSSGALRPARCIAPQKPKASRPAAIDMLNDQPILSPL